MEILKYRRYFLFSLALAILSLPMYLKLSLPSIEMAYASFFSYLLGVDHSYNVVLTKCPVIISYECVGITSLIAFSSLFLAYQFFIKENKNIKSITKKLVIGIALVLAINFLRLFSIILIANATNNCDWVKILHQTSWYLFSYLVIPYIAIAYL